MFGVYREHNFEEAVSELHELAKESKSSTWIKGEASKLKRHFLKDMSEFDTSAVDRIGRTIVSRKATILLEDDKVIITLLLADETGECYDLLEAAGKCEGFPILSQEEINQRAKEVRLNEYTGESSEREDQEAEEDLDIRLTRHWEEYLGVFISESDLHSN